MIVKGSSRPRATTDNRAAAGMVEEDRDCSARLEPHRHDALHADLDAWRANVGAPVAIDAADDAPDRLAGIDILCWNVAIGLGRLQSVLERLRAGAFGGAATDTARPLMIIVQEAYRHDTSVPHVHTAHHGGRVARAARTDIVEVATSLGLSLRYSPSMRNGRHASDRGNAILSTVRLDAAHAFLLPYVRQRRVAVAARIAGHGDITFVSAHLDTHGQPRSGAAARPPRLLNRRFGAGRVQQAHALAETIGGITGSVVLGADLNTLLGVSDPAMRALVAGGLHPARRCGTWRHTYHTSLRLLLDHVMFRSPDGRIAAIDVHRLDEAPGDRSSGVFGSDHHPLLARVKLHVARPAGVH